MIAVVATVAALSHGRPVVKHTRGCRTVRCDRRVGRAWWRRHHPRPILPWSTTASWYEDAGGTACGTHYALGIASHYEGQPDSAGLPCGMRVRICLAGTARCIVATVQDRGPYIAGREVDLNPGAHLALGCDLCRVDYGPA